MAAVIKRLEWDKLGERTYEIGTDHGVLYPLNDEGTYEEGVAWNGLTAVNETPSGGEETALWADNMKYLSIRSAEELGGTIEAYTYPKEFEECDGSKEIITGVTIGQQTRKRFGFSYRSKIGNDVKGNDYSEKIHIIYNASVSPTEKAHSTINDSSEADTFSWEFSTISSKFTFQNKEYNTSNVTIDLTGATDAQKTSIYNLLWGKDGDDNEAGEDHVEAEPPTLPPIQTLFTKLNEIFAPSGTE